MSEFVPIRVLLLHNYYQQPGGEDEVFASEARLLEAHGDEVIRYTVHNDRIGEMGAWELARKTVWNDDVYGDLRAIIRDRQPHVLHAHNTFPLISPAAYAAARTEGIPVVQTLHNYRLLCAKALLFRDGKVCEDCVGRRVMWPAVWHRCYRGSAVASAAVVAMLQYHRWRGTWHELVDVYIALTEFARRKLLEAGLPAAKVMVKPNFVGGGSVAREGYGDYMLFVGRLSAEKGLRTLLAAWELAPELPPLRIVGDGPLRGEVERAAAGNARVIWLGRRTAAEVQSLIRNSRALLFPSEWYEGFPLVLIEAYAAGVPVIGGGIGAAASLIEAGHTGLHYVSGDPGALAEQVRWAWCHPTEMFAMGVNGRARYQARYTGAINYSLLRAAYARAESTLRAMATKAEPGSKLRSVVNVQVRR